MTKYCRYHRNHGHTTEECKALQDKIAELVRAGHFRRFIRRDDHSSSSRSRHPPRSEHRRPPHDYHHNRHPTQPTNQEPEPARTGPTPPPPLLPEKDTSTIYNPSTTSPIPTTDAVCLLSSSQMMTSTASTTNKMTPWSSLLKSKLTLSRKSLLIKAAMLISSTGPPTKNSNFLTPPWSHMTSQYIAFLANRYPPGLH